MTAEINISWDGKTVPLFRIVEQLLADGFVARKINDRHFMVAALPDVRGIPAGVWFDVWGPFGRVGVERVNAQELVRWIPTYHDGGLPCGPVTMLLRVLALMRGEPVDESVDEDRLEFAETD